MQFVRISHTLFTWYTTVAIISCSKSIKKKCLTGNRQTILTRLEKQFSDIHLQQLNKIRTSQISLTNKPIILQYIKQYNTISQEMINKKKYFTFYNFKSHNVHN